MGGQSQMLTESNNLQEEFGLGNLSSPRVQVEVRGALNSDQSSGKGSAGRWMNKHPEKGLATGSSFQSLDWGSGWTKSRTGLQIWLENPESSPLSPRSKLYQCICSFPKYWWGPRSCEFRSEGDRGSSSSQRARNPVVGDNLLKKSLPKDETYPLRSDGQEGVRWGGD